MAAPKIIFTGGGGLLGQEFQKLRPKFDYPSSKIFDVTNYRQMESYFQKRKPKLIIHAAAYALPELAEKNPLPALETNIIGTANLVKLCMKFNIKLVYISTDYVFKGDRGNYKEEDALSPVNKYAWSKLGGECAVRLLPKFLIIRTSFSPKIFPYPKAFVDHFTSRQSVDVIAKKIAKAVASGMEGTIHLGGPRQSVYQFAKSLDAKSQVGKVSVRKFKFQVPHDTSLDSAKYKKLFRA